MAEKHKVSASKRATMPNGLKNDFPDRKCYGLIGFRKQTLEGMNLAVENTYHICATEMISVPEFYKISRSHLGRGF